MAQDSLGLKLGHLWSKTKQKMARL